MKREDDARWGLLYVICKIYIYNPKKENMLAYAKMDDEIQCCLYYANAQTDDFFIDVAAAVQAGIGYQKNAR